MLARQLADRADEREARLHRAPDRAGGRRARRHAASRELGFARPRRPRPDAGERTGDLHRRALPPAGVDKIGAILASGGDVDYRPINVTGTFDHAHEQHFFATHDGQSGYFVYTPLKLAGGEYVFVNRGFVPEGRLGEIKPASGPATVSGFLRAAEARGSFTPADLPANREFYTRDPAAIAASLGLGAAAPFYLEAERQGDGLTPPAGVDARELIARIPDNHLSYALTWFGLALTLIGVFAAFAWQGRRKG